MRSVIVCLLLAFLSSRPGPAAADWHPDGTAVCSEISLRSEAVSDGSGGVIVTWMDGRNGLYDIYAQRVDADGNPVWAVNGVPLCTAADYQWNPKIISDGSGGAIVTWYDLRNGSDYNIYAQRVDASGVSQWTADGVAVCTAALAQTSPELVSDGAGGALIIWQDYRSGNYDVYAQRVDLNGTTRWMDDGVPVCVVGSDQTVPSPASDGGGGMIAAWQDVRGGSDHIYAQRLDSNGNPIWTANGIPVCTAANYQTSPKAALDGAGGAVVVWDDYRSGTNYDIYAQRVAPSGGTLWALNGVALCTATGSQFDKEIVPDGANGAIVAWRDGRVAGYDMYTQRVDATGNPRWTADGVALCTAGGTQAYPRVVQDGTGGAIVAWQDSRNGSDDIYAQRVDAAGIPQWTADGTPISTVAGNQQGPCLTALENGAAMVAWTDYRAGTSDIFMQRLEGTYGYWGRPEPVVDAVNDIPNDQGGKVAVNWTASGRDLPVPRAVSHYTIWRAVDIAPMGASGETPRVLHDLGRLPARDTGPVYLSLSGIPYYWELVGRQDAHGWPAYSFSASTRADSVSGGVSNETFMVAAHDMDDAYIAFASNALSGHSVDNLAPASPLMLSAHRVGNDVELSWNRVAVSDLRDYAVYRAPAPGVTPALINFLSSTPDTTLVDAGAPATTLYYVVTASDVHENESGPSNEASVGTTGAEDLPSLAHLLVLANRPNPFASSTVFRMSLPAAATVAVDVFDVTGRRVRSEKLVRDKGWQDIRFDGRDDAGTPLASGTYFYRIAAAGQAVTRKILIAH